MHSTRLSWIGKREHQAVLLAVFRDVRHAAFDDLARRELADVLPKQADLPALDRQQAGQRVDQFGLPVALHAGDAQHLALAHIE